MSDDKEQFKKVAALRVRYGETDRMGIVFNSNYLSWFEVARTELCRLCGKSYREWEEEGFGLPVTEAYCRYRASARYDDLVDLYCRAPRATLMPHSIVFEYEAHIKDGALLATGWTKHAFVGSNGKVIRRNNAFQQWLLDSAGFFAVDGDR